MTEDELRRASKIEQQIRSFRIMNPDGRVQGGFGKLTLDTSSHSERLSNIEKALSQFRLIGGSGVNVSGGIAHGGYTIEAKTQVSDSGTGSGGGGPTPTGACCIGEACSILTEVDCATMSGVYQGDGTSCSPNPCAAPCECITPTLVCDSITIDKFWCGFRPFCTAGSSSCDGSPGDPGGCDDFVCTGETIDIFSTRRFFQDSTATWEGCPPDASGSITATGHIDDQLVASVTSCSGSITDMFAGYACVDAFAENSNGLFLNNGTGAIYLFSACGQSGSYSGEITYAQHISNVLSALDAATYDEDYNDACGAGYTVTDAGDSVRMIIHKFKYKFTFDPVMLCDWTLTWDEDGVPKSEFIPGGTIESSVYEVLPQDPTGTEPSDLPPAPIGVIDNISCTI